MDEIEHVVFGLKHEVEKDRQVSQTIEHMVESLEGLVIMDPVKHFSEP